MDSAIFLFWLQNLFVLLVLLVMPKDNRYDKDGKPLVNKSCMILLGQSYIIVTFYKSNEFSVNRKSYMPIVVIPASFFHAFRSLNSAGQRISFWAVLVRHKSDFLHHISDKFLQRKRESNAGEYIPDISALLA